jgi:hypothetical protein
VRGALSVAAGKDTRSGRTPLVRKRQDPALAGCPVRSGQSWISLPVNVVKNQIAILAPATKS